MSQFRPIKSSVGQLEMPQDSGDLVAPRLNHREPDGSSAQARLFSIPAIATRN